MSKSILVGKIINSTLSNNTDITTYVGNKIFPLVALNGTTYPFITYSRTNVYIENGSKDGWIGDTVSFQIVVESNKYDESCEIAQLVRESFENHTLSNDELTIYNIHLTGITEMFGNDDFIQTLDFECDSE